MPFAVIKTAKLFRLLNHPLPNSQAEANITWHIPIFHCFLLQPGYIIYHTICLLSLLRQYLTCASIGPPMLVIKLAEQALRPKRIGSLTLPMASFGGPLKRGVMQATLTQ